MSARLQAIRWATRLAGLLVWGSFLAGCRQQQLREAFLVEAFSAETRALEDKVYDLSFRVEDLEKRVDRLEEGVPSSAVPAEPRRAPTRPSGQPPAEIPDLSPPQVEPGRPITPDQLRQGSTADPAGTRAYFTSNADTSAKSNVSFPEPSDSHMVRLRIDDRTGLADWDGRAGVDGIWLAIRPENAAGEFLPIGGHVTAVLLDRVSRSHVGRWEFDELTVRRAARWEDGRPAVFLPLRWRQPPESLDLHLFVRWEDEQGQRWEDDIPLPAARSVAHTPGWKPRTSSASSAGPPAAVYR